MVRVLQVYPQMNNAGTERVIFNLYDNMDKSKVQFDFLVEKNGELDKRICESGGKIHYLNEKNNRKYYKRLLSFFEEHSEYGIVHTHTHTRMNIVLKAAKKSGITCRIAHSHNARNDLPKVASLIKAITSIPMELNANYFFACSNNAAKWLFPHKVKQCKVLYNGIQLNKYLFSGEKRDNLRRNMQLNDNEFVMIHVGRFAKQKNHQFLIDILEEYNKKYKRSWKMILVGVGPLQQRIKLQVEKKGLKEQVIFLDSRSDVNELLAMADMFVFPSLHEGLGIVVIEAQASGLSCIVSDAVPREADMEIGLMHTLSLKDAPEKWADVINEVSMFKQEREGYEDLILSGKYNIQAIAMWMQQFYVEHEK